MKVIFVFAPIFPENIPESWNDVGFETAVDIGPTALIDAIEKATKLLSWPDSDRFELSEVRIQVW